MECFIALGLVYTIKAIMKNKKKTQHECWMKDDKTSITILEWFVSSIVYNIYVCCRPIPHWKKTRRATWRHMQIFDEYEFMFYETGELMNTCTYMYRYEYKFTTNSTKQLLWIKTSNIYPQIECNIYFEQMNNCFEKQ